jgi:glycosyltransferase involved in cell wall biosynthesis
MKIAFIVPYVPNQVRTRSYNLITQLTLLGHEVDVFTVGCGKVDLSDAEALKSRCRTVYYFEQPVWRSLVNSALAVPSGKPLQTVYSQQPDLIQQLDKLFKANSGDSGYDVVHVEHLRGSEYGRFLKAHFPELPVVWDSVDCISYLFKQAAGQSASFFGKLVSRLELGRTEKTEADLLEIFDHVLVTSSMDRSALMKTVRHGRGPAPISVLSNGVDQDYFRPNQSIPKDPETLVFSGKMSYHANISMAKYLVNRIMPLIWRQRPNVRILVVGKDPPSEIKRLEENPQITVTGTVSDIRPFLHKSTVAVAPLVYGAGIQNKILEAMAVGLPVVTTSKALLSLAAVSNREILVGDSPREFSESVLNLLENPGWAHEIGETGRLYVREHHDWRRIAVQLAGIYKRVALPMKVDFA